MPDSPIEVKELKKVLRDTKRILKHHNELMIAKGDHFNLFSVLNLETRENRTHSAFLAELLNPEGSHLMGEVFLKLFLKVVQHNDKFDTEKEKYFDPYKAFVKVEHGIGNINLSNDKNEDPSKAKGGRIDIYLRDKNKNLISIENKIHAIDQEAQIQRYYNHNTDRNTVYYLTLRGDEPSEESKLKLERDKDFYNISYRDDITAWLELCLKEVSNFTSLREAINQYIVLIKKLTKIMSEKQNNELVDLMIANIEESSYIARNFDKALAGLRHNFRSDLIKDLKLRLNKEYYNIEKGKPVDKQFSQLWIRLKKYPEHNFSFGVESFSGAGHVNGDMFVGLLSKTKLPLVNTALEDENKIDDGWRHIRYLVADDEKRINLNDAKIIKILNRNKSPEYTKLLKSFSDKIVKFVEDYEKKLPKEFFVGKVIEEKN